MTLPIPLSIVAIHDHMLCRRSATILYKAYNQVGGASSDAQPTDRGSHGSDRLPAETTDSQERPSATSFYRYAVGRPAVCV